MMFRSVLLGLVAAVGLGGAAQSATVTFDFASVSTGAWATSLNYNVGGVGLTVTGSDTRGTMGRLQTFAGSGLGMKSASDCNPNNICVNNAQMIDSTGRVDIVSFAFNQLVRVKNIVFTNVDTGDTFNFFMGGALKFKSAVSPIYAINSTLNNIFSVGAGVTTQQVCKIVKGVQRCRTANTFSSFTIESITVQTAPVPVPAAGALMLGALGMAAGLRRKRRIA